MVTKRNRDRLLGAVEQAGSLSPKVLIDRCIYELHMPAEDAQAALQDALEVGTLTLDRDMKLRVALQPA